MKRRTLAASVVVTVSLADLACTSGRTTGNPPPPTADGGEEPISRNPPGPEPEPVRPPPRETIETLADGTCVLHVEEVCDPGDSCNPPPPRPVPCPGATTDALPIASNVDAVDRRGDGTCWEALSGLPCPEGVRCNPPPPRQVQCPPEQAALPHATNVARVHERPDGTCWEVAETKCPPKVMCNPPPPWQVQCPSDPPK